MSLSGEPLQRLLQIALAMQEGVLRYEQRNIDDDDIGFVYGKEVGERDLRLLLEGIPTLRPLEDQVAYLARTITCMQIFNNANKRFATAFSAFWFRHSGSRITADPREWEYFMLAVLQRCPQIPLSAASLQEKGCGIRVRDFVAPSPNHKDYLVRRSVVKAEDEAKREGRSEAV